MGPDFIVEDLQEMQGVLHMGTIGDFGATPLTSLYLTFDIAAAGGVMKDVPDGVTWGGMPARPIRIWLKVTAWLAR